MKRVAFLMLLLTFSGVALSISGWSEIPAAPNSQAPAAVPASLADFYPPNVPGPVYLIEMHNMSAPFSGIVSDFFEGDQANARANFEAFRSQYRKLAGMVPEWQQAYPMAPVDELGRALTNSDQGAVMKAADAVGRVCHDCHTTAMVPTQQRFHWGDFSAVAVTDPVVGHDASFVQLMRFIESDLSGIGNDLQQGQVENARAHAQGLAARYATLKETCGACHDSDREYFVDDRVMGAMAELKLTVESDPVQPEEVGRLLQTIGQESCFKCHLVHLPAAYSAHRTASR